MLLKNIRGELDCVNIRFLVILDHYKAFDTVNHKILCTKLKHLFYFSFTLTKLLSSYLENRTQTVCSPRTPFIFLICKWFTQSASYCKIHMYADDVQLYLSCSYVRKIDENIRKLKEEVNKVHRGKPKEILMSHCTQMRLLTNF